MTAGSIGAVFPLPEPADLVIASHFTFDDISKDITTLETKLKGTIITTVIDIITITGIGNRSVSHDLFYRIYMQVAEFLNVSMLWLFLLPVS